jgi:DNA-binding CsgD family transcriptional regulator
MDKRADTGALIGSIYEAGLDATRWPAFMESLASSLHAGFGNLWLLDSSNWTISCEEGGSVSASSGLDAFTIDRYKQHYAGLNVWLPNAVNLPEGALTVSSALYPDRRLKSTEFYDLFLRPNDLFYAVGSSVVKEGTTDVRMSFVRSEKAGPYEDGELHLVRQLMPHLRNAVVLHREMYRTRALAASSMAALELVPVGVALLTASGSLAHANQRAHDLFAGTGAMSVGPGGKLRAASTAATGKLQRLIHESLCTSAGKGVGHGGTLQLAGPSGRRLHVLVSPLPAHAAFDAKATAAVFCSDPDAVVGRFSRRLEIMYEMTAAEAQLTEALVNGKSLQEFADSRRVSMNTVRTQLKSASAKTGARRQADLVRMILTGPAIFKPPS